MIVIDWQVLRRLHVLNDIVKYLDLVYAHFDPVLMHILALVSLLVPRVRHHLLETVAQLWVRHQDVVDQTLDLVAQVACELVSSIQNLLVQALRVRVLKGKVTTDHREKYDTCTPEISLWTNVLQPLD